MRPMMPDPTVSSLPMLPAAIASLVIAATFLASIPEEPGAVVLTEGAIIQAVAGWGDDLSPNAIEVYVSRLRAKLEPAGIRIRTVRGFGYMLQEFREA